MKLLVSDYDGTLITFHNKPNIFDKAVLESNKKLIEEFIDKGNIFSIISGRTTASLLHEIDKYKIMYNYLLPYRGRVILDSNNNIISTKSFDTKLVQNIIKIIKENSTTAKVLLFDSYGYTTDVENIVEIKIKNLTNRKIIDYLLILIKRYKGLSLRISNNYKEVTITSNFNKALGVEHLIEKEKLILKSNDIYTIGDAKSDFEMIASYNGFRTHDCDSILKYNFPNNGSSIKKLLKSIK